MAFQFNHTSNFTKMIIIVEFLVVSYLLYTLTKSVYQSYQIDQDISNFKNQNDLIAQENKQKQDDYSYYSSDAYIEKIAKQNLGLVNQGEQVIVIPSTDANSRQTSAGDTSAQAQSDTNSIQALPNPQKWWKFFFDIHQGKQ